MANISIWTSARKGKPTVEWYSEIISEILETARKEESLELSKRETSDQLFDLSSMAIDPLPDMKILRFPEGYGWSSAYHFPATESAVINVCERALKAYDFELDKVRLAHEKNITAIENNKRIISGITTMMDKFGVRRSWTTYEYKTSRSRTRSEVYHACSWPSEVAKFIPTSDGYDVKVKEIEHLKEVAIKWRDQKIKEIKQKEEERQKIEKIELQRRTLAKLQVKYDLDASSTWKDVLNVILTKNKYLRLAHYLEQNRNDWSDGTWFAEIGIGGFLVESEDDQLIFDEIQGLIDNWDGDGRCFRDCLWNYHALYDMVDDEKLLEDYNNTMENHELL